jgi:beta-glucosidase
VSEHPELLQTILRKEWGFDGLVMSDWYGTYSTAEAINAGLDLEMPGPPRWRTPLLMNGCLGSRKILMSTLNKRAETVLKFVQKVARASPDIVYGDGQERSRDSLEIRRFCRRVAADGIVLLKNQGNILPIRGDRDCKIAVIGPNADSKVISGGGSAALKPTYVVTAWEGLVHNAPPGVELRYSVGAYAHKFLPTIEDYLTTPDGQPGWIISFFCHDSEGRPVKNPIASFVLPDTKVKLNDFLPDGLTPTWSITLRGIFTPTRTGPFEIGMAVCGKSRLYLNGELKVELWEEQTAGEFYYGYVLIWFSK